MAPKSDNTKYLHNQRDIVFIGEVGAGKSSAINLLFETDNPARVSNDSQPCTQASTCYETTLNGTKYNLWDTRGLGEGRNFLQFIFGSSSEKELKRFLKERHCGHGIDLLVYCIRGSRATKAIETFYDKFCAITRRLASPVAIMVTQLEKEQNMDDWWGRNSPRLVELNMEFDDHVCITCLPGHPRLAESREKLINLIARRRRWEAKDSGSYFGSRAQRSTVTAQPRSGGTWSLFKAWSRVNGEGLIRNYPASCAPSGSTADLSYYTAHSPVESTLSSPVVEPATPSSATASIQTPCVKTNPLGFGNRPRPPSDETSSAESSSHSMFHPSPHSSYTSYPEHLESGTEESEGYLNELPFKFSTATVRRRKSWATWCGAFGDVWECDLISGETPRMVAVKAVKTNTICQNDLKSHKKKLRRELKVWGRLQHRNIVPLLGVVSGFGPLPSTVSGPRRQKLLGDIAVVHSQDVIHGDLHSGNVLIDDDGTACLTDFGLSFISDFVGTSYLKSGICGGVQFADPALVQRADRFGDNVFYPTKSCDVYSFGGVMLHVLSGKKPYDGIPSTSVFLTVLRGERPQIPSHNRHVTPWHRSLIRKCWDPEECMRPLAEDLVKRFDRSMSK